MSQTAYKMGLMNDPKRDLLSEIDRIGKNNFDFIDLVLEPPRCLRQDLKLAQIKRRLANYNLSVVGHTWYDMHYAFPINKIKNKFIEELKKDFIFLKKLGCSKVAVHIDGSFKQIPKSQLIKENIKSLNFLAQYAKELDLKLLVENVPHGALTDPQDIAQIVNKVPNLYLLLDIGHANTVSSKAIWDFFAYSGKKIKHIHISDNQGQDQHLPIGLGNIDWVKVVKNMTKIGYKETITLEIFAKDLDSETQTRYQLLSSRKIQELLS